MEAKAEARTGTKCGSFHRRISSQVRVKSIHHRVFLVEKKVVPIDFSCSIRLIPSQFRAFGVYFLYICALAFRLD